MPNHSLKNPGACYRLNRLYRTDAGIAAALDECTEAIDAATTMRGIIEAIAESAHAPVPGWGANYYPVSQNFWMGKLRYTTYTKVGDNYVPDHKKDFEKAAFLFRQATWRCIDAYRMSNDMTNNVSELGENPGGNADGGPGVLGTV